MDQISLLTARAGKLASPQIKSESHEIELKFLVTESGFKATQQWAVLHNGVRRPNAQRLRTWYFDTEKGDLERHKMVLRTRAQRRGYVMTLKWNGSFPGGLFERGEIEVATASAEPDISLLGPEVAHVIAGLTQDRPLVPMYETDIRRITRRIQSGASDIEVAFDAGFIIAGEQKLPVREIELELKSGDPAELYRFGTSLAETYPVRLGYLAKSARGALLRSGRQPAPVYAAAPISGAPTVDAAIGVLINACLSQFAGNWPAFESGDGVVAIHQMRVAMRRLRSLLGLFQRAFPCAEFAAFRNDAKRIAAAMGEARNWDVFLALLRQGPVAVFPAEPGFEELLAQSEQHRAAGYDAVSNLLAAPETTRFILSLQAFVARSGWRNALPADALSRLTAPAKDFAAANLERLHQRLTKRGKNLAALPPYARHQIRIDLKKLRYTADLFSGLFENRGKIRAYTRAAGKLQDQLGIFNDLIVANEMVTQLDTSTPAANRAAGIITGWCARGALADDAALSEAWKNFRKAKLS